MSVQIVVVDSEGRRDQYDAEAWSIKPDGLLHVTRTEAPPLIAVYRDWRAVYRLEQPETEDEDA